MSNQVLIIGQSAVRLSVCATARGELLPPSYVRDRGPNSERGPVWINPPENTIIASDMRGRAVVGIVKSGKVRQLPESEAYKIWVMFRAKYSEDRVFNLFQHLPISRADRKLKKVGQDFPGVDLGRYVRIVRSVKDLPEGQRYIGPNWALVVVQNSGHAAYSVALPVGKDRHKNA